jgi:hypothetical protein
VAPIVPETAEQKRRHADAQARRALRQRHREERT